MNADTARPLVRDAIEADLDVCLRLDRSYTTEHVWQMEVQANGERVGVSFRTVRLPRPMRATPPHDAEALRQHWERHDCFLVVTLEDRVCGYLNMRVDAPHVNGMVVDLAVAPEKRRRGLGGALLRAARIWARENELSHITVETQTKNYPGICFCHKYGLRFCGYNDMYYPNQDIALFFAQRVRNTSGNGVRLGRGNSIDFGDAR